VGVSAIVGETIATDDQQELDALSLARPNQEPCVAGANRV